MLAGMPAVRSAKMKWASIGASLKEDQGERNSPRNPLTFFWVEGIGGERCPLSPVFTALLPPVQEGQPLEQVHVLLVLQQRAIQRRDGGLGVLRPQHLGRQVLDHQQLQPVQQLADVAGFFFSSVTPRTWKKTFSASRASSCLMSG